MANTNRYDRQIRLWGDSGQKCLQRAKICVLGSSACASETLKNLVLAGIGEYTIVDNCIVQLSDLGNNFCVAPESLGHPRADAVVEILAELNPDAKGIAIIRDPSEAAVDKAFIANFDLIIACNTTLQIASILCDICQKMVSVSLIWIRAWGFLGTIRLYAKSLTIVESHPESTVEHLRINSPFDELKEFALSICLSELDDAHHSHVPFVVLLLQAVERVKFKYGAAEMKAEQLKELVRNELGTMRRRPSEPNFQEAIQNLHKVLPRNEVPPEVVEILKRAEAFPSTDNQFWICANAVAKFYSKEGVLPLSGLLPDMVSDTSTYVRLRSVYQGKANKDYSSVAAFVESTVNKVDYDFLKTFCQHSAECRVQNYRTIRQEKDISKSLMSEFRDGDDDSLIKWVLLFTAAELFRQNTGFWPGAPAQLKPNYSDDQMLQEVVKGLSAEYKKLVSECFGDSAGSDKDMLKQIKAFVSGGGSELHTTCAFLGGIAAQEAVKLITLQFTPINNTFIYNGICSKGEVFEM